MSSSQVLMGSHCPIFSFLGSVLLTIVYLLCPSTIVYRLAFVAILFVYLTPINKKSKENKKELKLGQHKNAIKTRPADMQGLACKWYCTPYSGFLYIPQCVISPLFESLRLYITQLDRSYCLVESISATLPQSIATDRGWSQAKDYEIGMCCLSVKHLGVRVKRNRVAQWAR